MFNSPIDSPVISPLASPWDHGQSGVPGDPIWLALERDGFEDSIGLSSAALWVALPAEHRSIYLVDENTLRSSDDIIPNIEASEYLNDGGELIGNSVVGYAQYEDGTSVAILNKALKYFKINTEMLDALELLDSLVIIGA